MTDLSVTEMMDETEFIMEGDTIRAEGPWVEQLDEVAHDCGLPSIVHLVTLHFTFPLLSGCTINLKHESPARKAKLN